jgi:hypothetical protein
MTGPSFPDPMAVPESERELLVVYPDADRAERARAAVLAAGVPAEDVRIDAEPDRVASFRMEMHEELERAWIVPQAGLAHTKEGARGFAFTTGIGAAVGLVAAFPLALIGTASTYPVRLLVWAVVGMAFGAAIGVVAGPGIASVRPDAQMAAARGVLLRVRHDSPQLRALLADLAPLRMDELTSDDEPIETLLTEGPRGVKETVEDMAAKVQGDDYHAEPQRGSRSGRR